MSALAAPDSSVRAMGRGSFPANNSYVLVRRRRKVFLAQKGSENKIPSPGLEGKTGISREGLLLVKKSPWMKTSKFCFPRGGKKV